MRIMSKKPTSSIEAPEEMIEEQTDKNEKKRAILFARRSGRVIGKTTLMARGALLTSGGLLLLIAILFAASSMLHMEGAFTIRAARPVFEDKAISISETYGFTNPTVELSAAAIDGMDNTTYDWLPFDELDQHDGSYNGSNYIAYTFFLQNSGREALNYETILVLTKKTLGVDKAIRVMVYRNGEPTVYAAPRDDGGTETVPEGVVNFVDSDTVFWEVRENMPVGDIDRYTVVAWLEGEDADCINNIRGGTVRMELLLNVLDEDAEDPGETEPEETEPEETELEETETNVTEGRAE